MNGQEEVRVGMVITIPGFAYGRQGAEHFFGTRHGWPERSPSMRAVVSVRQVHGTEVLVIDWPVSGRWTVEGGWDALVTDQPGVLLTIRTADCVPVLIHDPVRRVVAAVHAGWRGALGGIIPKTIAVMGQRFGSKPASLRVGIGPAAGACCYEVDEPVLSRLRETSTAWPRLVRETQAGKALLDLRGLVQSQTQAAGVRDDAVYSVGLCTICQPNLFHSYRREGAARGTMVNGIMLVPLANQGHAGNSL